MPVMRDMDTGIYIKGDAGKLVIGGFEPDAKCWDAFGPEGNRPFLELPEDWDQFTPVHGGRAGALPGPWKRLGIQHFMNGPESFTADTRPLIGEAPSWTATFCGGGHELGRGDVLGRDRAGVGRLDDGRHPADGYVGGGHRPHRPEGGRYNAYERPHERGGRRPDGDALALQTAQIRTRPAGLGAA